MNPPDILSSAISQRTAELTATIPTDRTAATLALICAIDSQPRDLPTATPPDPFTGVPVTGLGNSRAFQILLQTPLDLGREVGNPDEWAKTFLEACGDLARAEFVLAHVETGFMRLTTDSHGRLEARIAQRATPLRWQERADDAWWATWLSNQSPLPTASGQSQATDLIDRLARRYDLPIEGSLAGIDLHLAKRMLPELQTIADSNGIQIFDQRALIAQLAEVTGAVEDQLVSVIEALTLDATNAAWHAAVPGIVDPPLVRLPDGRLVVSRRGASHDPFRFLTRELRRRDPDAYHSAAAYREVSFRRDLYSLFSHRRFVTSSGTIELRRDQGSIRTDIDAAIFDRKSGTLAIFELKTNEPFARSTAELNRSQENVRAAGRQVASILDWINRHGADDILNRIDRRTAKGFRVQKVQAFVLGRHLVVGDDRRAVWATWPQVLRALGVSVVEDLGSNPIVALARRLDRMEPSISTSDVKETSTITVGSLEIPIYSLRQGSR